MSTTDSTLEKNKIIQEYFTETKTNNFRQIIITKSKIPFFWNEKELENKLFYSRFNIFHFLKMEIEYRNDGENDAVFFIFSYTNGSLKKNPFYPLMLYFKIDDGKTITLKKNMNPIQASTEVFDINIENNIKRCTYIGEISMPISDFITLAYAKKVDFGINFSNTLLEQTFTHEQLTIIKGFYNAVFEPEFEQDLLYQFINKNDLSILSKEENTITAYKDRKEKNEKSIQKQNTRNVRLNILILLVLAGIIGCFVYFLD